MRVVGWVAWGTGEVPERAAGATVETARRWAVRERVEEKRRRRGNLHPNWVGEKGYPKTQTVAATATVARATVKAEEAEATGEGKKGAAARAAARLAARRAAKAERVGG